MTENEGLPVTTRALAERAAVAYRTLADLAESIEDEWLYVNDLVEAYLPAIRGLGELQPVRPAAPEAVAAVDETIAEVGLITDPHRAIDWLSTFPHLVALAMGGDVDTPSEGEAAAAASRDEDDDDGDSPFAALLRRGR